MCSVPSLSIPLGLLIGALVLGISSQVSCSGGLDLTPEEHISRAKDYQDKGELRAASIELKNALRKAPNNREARWLLGRVYLEVGDGAAAEKELRRAIEFGIVPDAATISLARAALLQGKNQEVINNLASTQGLSSDEQAELWALRGHAYLALGKRDEADKAYNSALSVKPNAPDAGVGKARLAAAQKHLDEAREWLDKVLETTPEFAPAWSLLGDLERYKGKAQEAENAYGKAIAYRFNNAGDLLNRLLMRIYLKDYDGAANDLQTLRSQTAQSPGVAYAQGLLDFQREKYAEAQTAFEEALQYAPDYMPAVYYLGISHYMQDHAEQAEQYVTRFLDAFPKSDQAAKVLGAVRLRKRDLDGAQSVLIPVLARNPHDLMALNLLSNVALARGEPGKSTEYLQHVIDLRPESISAYMKLGIGLVMEGEHDRGLQALEHATELEPESQQADFLVILTHMQAREFDKAVEAAQLLHEKHPNSSDPLVLIAGAYLGKGDETKAREALNQALQIAPGDPSAAGNLARLELRDGQAEKAHVLYEEVLKHRPTHLATLVALAQLEAHQGQVEEAKARLEYTVQENPEALEPRLLLASYYLRIGQPARALAITRDVQETYANHPSLLAAIGEAQLGIGEPASALSTLKKLVKIAPKSAQAHFLLAKAYADMNYAKKVHRELDEALKLDPSHILSKIAMTRLLMEENKPEEASKLLHELRQAQPQHPEVVALEGTVAIRQNRPQEAVNAFQKAAKLAPSSQMTVYLALAQWQTNDKEGSIATLKKWLEKYPTDLLVQYHLANSYLMLNRLDQAKSTFANVVEQSPHHVLALNNLAWLLRKDDPTKALKYAEHAHELAPYAPVVMDTLGTLLLDQGQTPRAQRLLREASEKAPGDLDIRYHLALALARGADKIEARKILKEMLGKEKPFEKRTDAESLLKSLGG